MSVYEYVNVYVNVNVDYVYIHAHVYVYVYVYVYAYVSLCVCVCKHTDVLRRRKQLCVHVVQQLPYAAPTAHKYVSDIGHS